MKKLLFILLSLPLTTALAWWDGVEPSTGTKVEIISKRNKIRKNGVIEIFDHGNNAYHEVESNAAVRFFMFERIYRSL